MSKYSKEFKEEALKLSDEIGVKKVALQLVLHSDRGSQYTSEAFRNLLKKYEIAQSLSGTGRCYDNARMESFFATLKKEKLYRIPTYRMTREDVKTVIFRYVFIYYNRIRLYTGNPGNLSPEEYRVKYEAKKLVA